MDAHIVIVSRDDQVEEVWAEDGDGAPLTADGARALATWADEASEDGRRHHAVTATDEPPGGMHGPCGAEAPRIVDGPPVFCRLRAGHDGWHEHGATAWSPDTARPSADAAEHSISAGYGALPDDRCTCDGESCGAWDECREWAERGRVLAARPSADTETRRRVRHLADELERSGLPVFAARFRTALDGTR